MDNKIAHLGFIESTIERMANNSASIKGWSMAIAAALIGIGVFGGNEIDCSYRIIMFVCAAVITVVMWFLDAFYLYQEKLYRNLYSLVNDIKDDSLIDFSMDATYKTIKKLLDEKKPEKKPMRYLCVLKNRTVIPFYLPQLLVYFLFFIVPIWVK